MVSRRAALVALALVLGLPACSTLPTDGPVRQGRDLQLERADPAVRPIGQPPARGAKPDEIVLGFLRAGADFEGDHAIARQYLAPAIRKRWRPRAGAVLYNPAEGDLSLAEPVNGQVSVGAPEVARIEADGKYVAAAQGAGIERIFSVARVSGEWRITALDDGLVLARSAVPEIYRQVNLYFRSPSRKVLVPDTVFLPALPGLPTNLVSRLLRGPSSALRTAVKSGFPQGTSLAVSSVPIRDGVASVRLDATAGKADEANRELMSAQLVWTLKQLPEFQALRISIDDEPLRISGAPVQQPADSWLAYDPGVISDQAAVYVVRDGRSGRLLAGEFVPIDDAEGRSPPVRSVGVSLDEARLAEVSADGRSLLLRRLGQPEEPTVRLSAADLSPPTWDQLGTVWVADRGSGRLWSVASGATDPLQVTVDDGKSIGAVTTVKVARDGARVAIVAGRGAGSRLYVGAVIREPDGPSLRVTALREVLPGLRQVRDVAWAEATRLAVIGLPEDVPDVPFLVDISGYEVSLIEPQPDLVTIAAAPSHPIVAATRTGRVQQYTASGEWKQNGPGGSPAYPG